MCDLSPSPSDWFWLVRMIDRSLITPVCPRLALLEAFISPYLGEFGIGKYLSLRQSQDYVFSLEITGTFIVFEGEKNLIIEVKEGYTLGFF